MSEPTLFDLPESTEWENRFVEPIKQTRRTDPATSLLAAQTTNLKGDRKRVLEVFRMVYPKGLIDEELEQLAGLKRAGTASKRRSDLSKLGLLVWKGEYRLTTADCKSRVWYHKD